MELKFCPFCGGEATLTELCQGYFYVVCENCGASSGIVAKDKEDVCAKWNCRTVPPNAPLTLDELRQMEGEPVWIVGVSCINNFKGHWDICDWQHLDGNTPFFSYSGEGADPDLFGVTWLAYRRRPEEGTT